MTELMIEDREIIHGSIEYLDIPVTSDVQLTMAVEISVDHGANWLDAAWIGDAGTTRTARTLLDTTEMSGRCPVWVKFTDTPEIPIILAGFVKVI